MLMEIDTDTFYCEELVKCVLNLRNTSFEVKAPLDLPLLQVWYVNSLCQSAFVCCSSKENIKEMCMEIDTATFYNEELSEIFISYED